MYKQTEPIARTCLRMPAALISVRRTVGMAGLMAALLAFSWTTTTTSATAGVASEQPNATIVVNSLGDLPDINPADGICQTDANNCSLRAAIETAQGGALPGADTIDVSGLAGTIFLGSGVLPEIVEDLIIIGPSVADALVINATGEHQHLRVQAGATVEIIRVYLTNGLGGTGGSIDNAGSLTLTGVIISDTFANDGGAIYNRNLLTLSEAIITDSRASADGGAIYTAPGSTLIVRDGSQIGLGKIGGVNTADYGGGIYNDDGSVTIFDSTITDNAATFNGGGIYNYRGDLSVESYSLVQENSAGDYGGGIYNVASGVVDVSNSTLVNNTAWAGGGIYNYYSTLAACGSAAALPTSPTALSPATTTSRLQPCPPSTPIAISSLPRSFRQTPTTCWASTPAVKRTLSTACRATRSAPRSAHSIRGWISWTGTSTGPTCMPCWPIVPPSTPATRQGAWTISARC